MWNKVLEVDLPSPWHIAIKDLTFNAIDVVLGFDFAHPRGNCFVYDARCLGSLRIRLSEGGAEILKATRNGIINAVKEEDPSGIEKYLSDYWAMHTYEPYHTGRCYPHGHAEFADAGYTPLECQVEELRSLIGVIVVNVVQHDSR